MIEISNDLEKYLNLQIQYSSTKLRKTFYFLFLNLLHKSFFIKLCFIKQRIKSVLILFKLSLFDLTFHFHDQTEIQIMPFIKSKGYSNSRITKSGKGTCQNSASNGFVIFLILLLSPLSYSL